MPWLDHSQNEYAVIDIDRAEGFNHGKRPDSFVLNEVGNQLIAWPTKLTLAPALASAMLKRCEGLQKQGLESVECLQTLERASVSQAPWELARYVR